MKTILLKAAYFTIGAIVLMACGKSKSNQAFSEKSVAPHESPAPPQSIDRFGKIPNEFVCMVNNAFMGIPQIAVEVEGKTYYGCCDMCEQKLKDSDEHRYAKDPLTGEQVDKATAFIVLTAPTSYQVAYFASEANFQRYKESH